MPGTLGGMRIIAVEEHTQTSEIDQAVTSWAEREDPGALHRRGGELARQLYDTGAGRLAAMDDAGVDVQVLSITTPATQVLDAGQAVPLARAANDWMAGVVRDNPARFAAFATLPTPDPPAAADELHRAVTGLGMCGAMIHGRTGDRYLDHPSLRPVLAAAAELDVPLYIHPQLPPRAVREVYYAGFGEPLGQIFAGAGWGWHVESGVAALRMVLAGVFDELPSLQIVLGHWGEMLAFYFERVDERLSALAGHLQRRVGDYIRGNMHVTPSGLYVPSMFQHALQVMGADRIMWSVDHPYVRAPGGRARAFLEEAPVSAEDREKIAHGNAERLLRLPT